MQFTLNNNIYSVRVWCYVIFVHRILSCYFLMNFMNNVNNSWTTTTKACRIKQRYQRPGERVKRNSFAFRQKWNNNNKKKATNTWTQNRNQCEIKLSSPGFRVYWAGRFECLWSFLVNVDWTNRNGWVRDKNALHLSNYFKYVKMV